MMLTLRKSDNADAFYAVGEKSTAVEYTVHLWFVQLYAAAAFKYCS